MHSGGAITLSPSNIVNGRMSYDNCTYISWDKYEESPEIQISNNDILLVKTGSSYGKCALVTDLPQAATINPQFVVLKYISYNAALLRYVLQSNYARSNYERFVLGTAIPTFTQVVLGDMLIPLPPANEQIKIIKEIDRWFAIIDEIESGTIELESYVKQTKSKILDLAISGKLVPQDPNDEPAIELLKRINSAFKPCDNSHYENLPFEVPDGWCWAKINDVTEFIKNGAQIKQFKGASGIPITRIETISNSELDMARMGYANITNGAEYKDYYIKDGDILMSHINSRAHIGKCALCNVGENQIIHGMNLLRIRCSKQILPEYMVYYFRSTTFYNLIEPHIKNAVNQASINITNLQKILIPIPPYSEQRRVAFIVDKLFSTIDTITAEL